MSGFSDPAVRAAATQRSIEARRKKAEARHQEMEARRNLHTPPVHPDGPPQGVNPDRQALEAATAKAAAGLPALDNMFEMPEARRADALDIKLAGMRANSGRPGVLGRDAVRRVSTFNDLTSDARAYGNESRPRQLHQLAVDSTEPGKIVMYDDNWVARAVPEQNFRAGLSTGKLHHMCPGCGGEHLKEVVVDHDRYGEPITQLVPDFADDACPQRGTVMKIRCPICAQRGLNMVISDRPPQNNTSTVIGMQDDDSFVSMDFVGEEVDPVEAAKKRLRHWLSIHMAWVHPEESLAYGIDVARIKEATTVGASANTALIR